LNNEDLARAVERLEKGHGLRVCSMRFAHRAGG
jgi:hypothetical protein